MLAQAVVDTAVLVRVMLMLLAIQEEGRAGQDGAHAAQASKA